MNYHSKEEMWLCYSCAYEELQKDEVRGKNEEKSEHANAPEPAPASKPISDPFPSFAVPLASMITSESQKSKKGSSPSKSQPSGKKKTCPACRKKMDWYDTERTWRCSFCHYERSI
jgi:hypothetical protein